MDINLTIDTYAFLVFIIIFTHNDVQMPESLKEQYPEKITIVLQHQFKDLKAETDHFSVKLFFEGVGAVLKIPYEATIEISIPSIGIKVQQLL